MALIKVAGTAKDQSVYLCISRKPEAPLKSGEYEHRNTAGELKEFRKKLPDNSIGGLTLNRLQITKFESANGDSYPVTLYVTHRTGTHLINLGAGGIAKSVANTLLWLEYMTDEQIASALIDLSFYTDKNDGKNKVSVKINGSRWEWAVPKELKDSLVTVSEHKGKKLVDDTQLCELLMEKANVLNTRLPKSAHKTEDALDSFFGDTTEVRTESSIDEDFPDSLPPEEVEVPKAKPTNIVEDIPFV